MGSPRSKIVTETIDQIIGQSLAESNAAKNEFWETSKEKFFDVGDLLKETIARGNKILICGNGGSSCDAQHFAGELVGRYRKERPGLACIALNSDGGILTCVGNDYGFEEVFARQVQALGQKGDVLIAISTSGNSPNVLEALKVANEKGMKTVGLCGGRLGKMLDSPWVDHVLQVAATPVTARIQEAHGWILHSLCEYIDHG
jgi:D-sedoheptulose 7-phosphate isomerase